ncbi:MAG: 50S ribosomal protein L1 [Candidatus Omnitrophota bacterium]
MDKSSKRYKEALKLADPAKKYPLKEAISILKQMPKIKFDESVDLHLKLNVDSKNTEQAIRGTVVLPHGTGKKVKVAVFCKGEQEKEARDAGADFIGGQDLIDKVAGGFLDFDCAVATPEMMKDLSKLGKLLGPRGLMPSPKTGTVTMGVGKIIKELKAGKIEFKMDKQSGIHASVGKISFDEDKLIENADSLLNAIRAAKPAAVKGQFIDNISIASSMSPGLRLTL